MQHRWIIDVLDDLGTFARHNELPLLAEHLDQAAKIAIAEATLPAKGAPLGVFADGSGPGRVSCTTGAGRRP